jgi:hypothetical protein
LGFLCSLCFIRHYTKHELLLGIQHMSRSAVWHAGLLGWMQREIHIKWHDMVSVMFSLVMAGVPVHQGGAGETLSTQHMDQIGSNQRNMGNGLLPALGI